MMYFEAILPIRFKDLSTDEMATRLDAHDDLLIAAKDACLHIADLAKVVDADYKNNSTFMRLINAINKAEGKK